MIKNFYLGIDPGATGGMALIDEDANILYTSAFTAYTSKIKKLQDMTNAAGINAGFDDPEIDVLIEKPIIRSGPVMKNIGELIRDAGIWEGICYALGFDVMIVPPSTWQAPLKMLPEWHLRGAGADMLSKAQQKKYRGLALVRTLYGEEIAKKYCETKRGAILDGICDALLMASLVRRFSEQKENESVN